MNYYCMYCSQRCTKMFPESPYWNCGKCGVRYMEGTSGCDVIEFHRKLKEGYISYRLDLYVQLNRTILNSIESASGPDETDIGGPYEKVIVDVKGVLNGVNPDNVKDKIKNLLLFL